MSEEIIKLLDNLAEKFGIAIDWTSSNVLPYLQDLMGRYVNLCNAQAITWILICIAVLIAGIVMMKKLIKWKDSESFDEYNDDILLFTIAIILCCLEVGIVIAIICNLFGLYQNIFIPELTVLNYLKILNN